MPEYPVPFINLEYFFYQAYRLITGEFFGDVSLGRLLENISVLLFPFSVILSLLILAGIVYCYIRIGHIEHEMAEAHAGADMHTPPTDMPNRRWVRIVDHLNSDNESDWRLAILEADLVLEEMLEKMGYEGQTIADRLKGIEVSDFTTMNDAWEGHRVRNLIAHEGGDYRITNREARRVVSLFEKVFMEFHFI